jgi:hypothetical protein
MPAHHEKFRRHALPVKELCELAGDLIHLDNGGSMKVDRVKCGDSSTHYMEGNEIYRSRICRQKIEVFTYH